MPAQSQQQQKLFGLALAFKRGEVPASEVSDEIKDIADRMSEKEIEDFASTKHKGLPKMKEQLRKIVREIMRERVISEMNEVSKPSIKMVNKFEPKEGIQIMAVKTLDGKTHFGGMVQRGKLARIIPFVPNQSKSDVQKRALQIFDELGKDESVNEAKYKVGDTITVIRKDGMKYKGKVEKLNPLKLRTDSTSTVVLPNSTIKGYDEDIA